MIRALFVSDIHIQSPTDARAELFRRLIVKCQDNPPTHLFLVGDIFDLWVADRDFFVSAYQGLIDELVKLKNLGCEIHYFEGNHDLDLRLYWQHKLGFDVQSEAAFYQLGDRLVRVEHGDQMDPEDRGYLFLRWLLRTPFVRFLGRALPNQSVAWIGRRASLASRDYTTHVKSVSDQQVREKIRVHAQKVFPDRPFDIFISGHVHVAEDTEVRLSDEKVFRCVNTGTWLKEALVFVLEDSAGRLLPVENFIKGI